jgi:glycosyltransferase involved in cell wall biosynthesis
MYGYGPVDWYAPYGYGGSRGYGGYDGPEQSCLPERSYPEASAGASGGDALRVIHVNLSMFPAGIDRWLTGLIRHSDPRRLAFLRCIVTGDLVDWRQVGRVGVPVEIGGRESIRRACRDCDVLLISDPGEEPDWVDEVKARLCVLVAHGDGPWTRARMERLAGVVHHVVAVSKQVERSVCAGFRSTVIPNGVDPLHLARSRPRHDVRAGLGFAHSDFVVGFVGRFSEEKNPFAVVDAVARLSDRFKLLLIGFGPLEPSLRARAETTIPGRFALLRADDCVGDLYAAMDVFCLASYSEGYGLAIMEAMMCAKPVIVSPVGLVPDEIKDGVNGVVVCGDADSIRAAVARLEADRSWAASIGHAAADHAERTGYASTMATRYADLFESLWAERRSGRGTLSLAGAAGLDVNS